MSGQSIIVVESPAKSQTIEKFLGSSYKVHATFGHIRDLPKHDLGVDVEHNFEPKYVIPTKSKKTIAYLKKVFADADKIYLATDYDREGEAISWHVMQACGLNEVKSQKSKVKSPQKVFRITFHEITKTALENALKNPRDIDMNLVNAQQARRVLDRLVGYKLSPFLWKKITKGLSAGRVQSVALRLIVDREREIEKFKPQEYWEFEANFESSAKKFKAKLQEYDGKKISSKNNPIAGEKQALEAEKAVQKDNFSIRDYRQEVENKYPFAPFTTSTLQQEASYKLRFSSKQTMKLAQDLYEAGLITYMRTDSTTVASIAVNSTRSFIEKEYGKNYLSPSARQYKTKSKGAQEAHEAIRPAYPDKKPDQLDGKWSDQHKKLYTMIWNRLIATQMSDAQIDKQIIEVQGENTKSVFVANGQKIKFDGYLKVYPMVFNEQILPDVSKGGASKLIELLKNQKFTQPPQRFSEARLIKTLEEFGIGRPSTYAPIISTLLARGYVRIENRIFFPQEIGMMVIDLLAEHFAQIIDTDFTSEMENKLDGVAEGKQKWVAVLSDFWQPFSKLLEEKTKDVKSQKIVKELDEKCPECAKQLVERFGRFGKFIACSGFPSCKYSRNIVVKTGVTCPDCQKGEVIERHTKKGKPFWGCEKFPKCKYATWNNPVKQANEKTEINT